MSVHLLSLAKYADAEGAEGNNQARLFLSSPSKTKSPLAEASGPSSS
jgi:hypothetical protein